MDGASHGSQKAPPVHFPFLSLPAEVRNKVYGFLYEFDEPLHIVAADEEPGKSVLHRAVDADYLDITMFLVSRKIYEEASSVLYKHNTFTFVRMYSFVPDENDPKYDFLTYFAVPWICDLGSRAQLLRKVSIDLGVSCPARCASVGMLRGARIYEVRHLRDSEESIHIGPLLCALWRHTVGVDLKVRRSIGGAYAMWLSSRGYSTADLPDVSMLSWFIPAIFQDHILRKYIRTIGSISVYTKKSSANGVVEFLVAHKPLPLEYVFEKQLSASHNWSSITTKEDRTLQLQRCPPYPLLGLPRRILALIEEHAYPWTRKTIDLDDHAGRLAALGPYCLSRQWRDQFGDKILYGSHYVFRLSSAVQTACFPEFKSLHSLLNTLLGENYSITQVMAEEFSHRISSTISINFVLGQESTLRDPRYNIMPLIKATIGLHGSTKVVNTMRYPDNEDIVYTTTLCQIRRDAMKVWPPTSTIWSKELPEIWVNGLFQTITVVEEVDINCVSQEDRDASPRNPLSDLAYGIFRELWYQEICHLKVAVEVDSCEPVH